LEEPSEEVLAFLKAHPDVVELREEKFAYVIDPTTPFAAASSESFEAGWNIELIGAVDAWNVTQGENIVVSNIDTGVRYTHESLIGSYRGADGNHNYNWFDPAGAYPTAPGDGNGHGTHTMGTIAGSEASGVGVAPGSKWIAAKGCRTALCPEGDLTASAEFVICPTDLNGNNADCSLGADVVSNSWGGGQGDTWYMSYVEAWRDAGSIPVFAQGNAGPQCNTANSPGDYDNVIGVGATDSNDQLASFSSRGPSTGGSGIATVKPDISAPGALIRSASSSGDGLYSTLSGTSMACPHITGVVALMLSANPSMDYDQVFDIMTSTAFTGYGAPNGGQTTCGGISYSTIPNNHYGYGRVDAHAAVLAALSMKN
jgi:subtilisin family serine protease